MKLYREKAKAQAMAILEASPSIAYAARATGVPRTTLNDWKRDPESSLITTEERLKAKKHFAERVEEVRSLYLERAMEPDAVAKTSGFYAVLSVKHLNEVHQLLTGGPTHRVDLATFLTTVGGGDETNPELGGGEKV